MNKTYIKRQLTLNELGFPLDEYIQKCVDYFNELIGDPNHLTKEYKKRGELFDLDSGYLYMKDNIKLIYYNEPDKYFVLNYNEIVNKMKIKELYNEEIINFLLEKTFNVKTRKYPKYSIRVLIE